MRILLCSIIRGTKGCAIFFCLVVYVTSLGRVDADRRSASAWALPLPTPGPFRQYHDTTTGAKSSVSSVATFQTTLLTTRGGALSSTASTATATATNLGFGALIARIGHSISSSKSKCWIVLILTILTETFATTVSKHARDTGSFHIFLAALCLNLIWYVSQITDPCITHFSLCSF
jgi:hypothetical protein